MQCSRSPRALLRNRHSLRLGGQHGEEAKEDGEGGEEGREKDPPEEEISRRRFSVFDLDRESMTASHGPARVESDKRIAIAVRHRRLRSTAEGVGETGDEASAFLRSAPNAKRGQCPQRAVAWLLRNCEAPTSHRRPRFNPVPALASATGSLRGRIVEAPSPFPTAAAAYVAPLALIFLRGSARRTKKRSAGRIARAVGQEDTGQGGCVALQLPQAAGFFRQSLMNFR
jgi:hypothetical protein